jgi:hypothetical protein
MKQGKGKNEEGKEGKRRKKGEVEEGKRMP